MSDRYNKEMLDRAYDEGQAAYHAGLQIEHNKYDADFEGELHHKWEEGFLEAEENDNIVMDEDDEEQVTNEDGE